MKKFLFTVIAFAAACGVAQAQKTPKVAVVDIPKVVNEFKKASDQRDLILADFKATQEWAQEQEKALVALRNRAEAMKSQSESALLSEPARVAARANLETLAREFQSGQEQYLRSRQDKEAALNSRQQAMSANIVEEIRPVVEAVAKEKGADLVLNSAAVALNVLFVDASLDISAEVVKRLNATYTPRPVAKPAPAPAAPAAAAPASGAAPASPAPAAAAPRN